MTKRMLMTKENKYQISNNNIQIQNKSNTGISPTLNNLIYKILLHVGHQGDHIWVKVLSDIGLGYAPNI